MARRPARRAALRSLLLPKPVAYSIAMVVVLIWATAQIAHIFNPGYDVPDGLHAAVMLALGFVFAISRKGDDDEDDDGDDGDDPDDGGSRDDNPDDGPRPRDGREVLVTVAELLAREAARARDDGGQP